jgi:hypothetical protein
MDKQSKMQLCITSISNQQVRYPVQTVLLEDVMSAKSPCCSPLSLAQPQGTVPLPSLNAAMGSPPLTSIKDEPDSMSPFKPAKLI